MVPEIMIGSVTPISSNTCSTAKPAALALSVSNTVSIRMISTPPSIRPARLRGVGLDQRVEAHIAEARIVHVGRDRGGAVGGADGAGDEARLVGRLLGPGIGRLARELGRGDVHLIGDVLEPVIGLADGLGVEGVGLDDVGAGFEIGIMDLADDLRLGQHQQIVVALEIAREDP